MTKSLMTLMTVTAGLLFSPAAQAVKVSAVGDIMMGTNYPSASMLVDRDFFKVARNFLSASDIRFGNLEGTLYDGGLAPDGKRGGANRYLFRTPTAMVTHLVNAGFNVMSLANNHARDFGRAGLNSTKKTLSENGIGFSSKDGEVADIEIDGQRIALISADFYPGKRSIVAAAPLYAEIRELKAQYDIVIVTAHSGAEGFGATHTPNANETFLGESRGNSVKFARTAIDSGADLVLMAGPHVPRGLEVYKDRLVAYSLGNFVTEKGISIGGHAGLAPLLEIDLDREGRFTSGTIHSFRQIRGTPVSLDPAQKAFRLMRQMSGEDFPSSSPDFGADGRSIFPRATILP